jgi:hypothetical protein
MTRLARNTKEELRNETYNRIVRGGNSNIGGVNAFGFRGVYTDAAATARGAP